MDGQQLHYRVTDDDYLAASVVVYETSHTAQRTIRGQRIWIGALTALATAFAWFALSAPVLAGYFAVLGILGVAFIRKSVIASYRRRLTKIRQTDGFSVPGPHTASITDEGLKYESEAGISLVRWPYLQSITETDDLYILGLGSMQALVIPKRPDAGAASTFINQIRERATLPA